MNNKSGYIGISKYVFYVKGKPYVRWEYNMYLGKKRIRKSCNNLIDLLVFKFIVNLKLKCNLYDIIKK